MRSLLGRFHRPMSRGLVNNMLTMNNLGDGSTLSLDFTAMGGVLDPRLTFTRASTVATYINSSGYVATATTNEPRFDYSPTNIGQPKGLLVEGSSTNLLTYSNAMNQNPWFETANVTRTNFTGGNGPDNVSNSGSKVAAANIATGNTLYYNGTTSVSGNTYTYSMWAKADGANWIWLNFFYFGVYHGAFFDLSGNGALGNTTGTIVAGSNTITKYPNGWFRLTVSHTATFTIFYTGMVPCTSNGTGYASIIGQSPNGVLIYGAQVEAGSGASSYIPTGASQVTRNADQCELTSGVPALYNSATSTGTFLIDISHSELQNANGGIELGAGTGNQGVTNRVSCRRDATFVGGTTLNLTPTGAGQRFKTVTAFAPSDLAASRNGTSAVTSSTNVTLTGMTALKFYIDAWAGGSLPVYGAVRQVKIWPTRLSNATIQTLSAL